MLQRIVGTAVTLALVLLALTDTTPQAILATGALTLVAVAVVGLRATPGRIPDSAPRRSRRTIASDERSRGSFRRQSHPGAPGRPLPRAPQTA